MRPIFLGQPAPGQEMQWIMNALYEIERASQEDVAEIADSYAPSNFSASRTLNAGSATLVQLANVVATFLADMQRRGVSRTS